MAYSPLACKFIQAHPNNYTPNRSAWGQDKITEICIHYMAGNCSIETLGGIWQNPNRLGSSTYGIGSDGRIACYVDEKDVAWCNSNWDSNVRSASIETANLQPDSRVTDEALNSLIKLCADIAVRNGMGKLVKGKNLTWHQMYTSTSCPGQYLLSKLDYIVNEANRIIDGGYVPDNPKEPDQVLTIGSKVMLNGIFRVDDIILPNSKYPNGAVGCFKTCYGSPVGDDDWIPSQFIGKCDTEGNKVDYDGIIDKGDYFICDKIFTVVDVDLPNKYIPNGVATIELDGVRFRADCGPLYEVKD